MLVLESVIDGLKSLFQQKTRAFLTILALAFGIAVVIIILSVGSCASKIMEIYYSGMEEGKYINLSMEPEDVSIDSVRKKIPIEMCNEFNSNLPDDLYGISLTTEKNYSAKVCDDNGINYDLSLDGLSEATKYIYQLNIQSGRFITQKDCDEKRSSVVISDILANKLFGSNEKSLQKEMLIKGEGGISFYATVVGVYKQVKTDTQEMTVFPVYASYTFINEMYGVQGLNSLDNIKIAYREVSNLNDSSLYYISEFFNNKFVGSGYMAVAYYSNTIEEDSARTVQLITFAFIFISGISFIVSGLGLTNTLLMSVSERTKEIGIRRALGESDKSIKIQFFAESCGLCLIACIFGVALGVFADYMLTSQIENLLTLVLDEQFGYVIANAGVQITPTRFSIIIVTVISLLLGLVFGTYPAEKAIKMQPVDALRYE